MCLIMYCHVICLLLKYKCVVYKSVLHTDTLSNCIIMLQTQWAPKLSTLTLLHFSKTQKLTVMETTYETYWKSGIIIHEILCHKILNSIMKHSNMLKGLLEVVEKYSFYDNILGFYFVINVTIFFVNVCVVECYLASIDMRLQLVK